MTPQDKKDFLDKLDEFLALIDPEQMIRDGYQFIRFRYLTKSGEEITETFDVKEINKNDLSGRSATQH